MPESPAKKSRCMMSELWTKLGMPPVGLGTANLKDAVCTEAVIKALEVGYRHIDTALLYGNQEAIGKALKQTSVPRDQIWITSKVAFFPANAEGVWMWSSDNVKGGEAASIDKTLKQLEIEQLDLLLVHNPATSQAEYNSACIPHFFELLNMFGDEAAVRPTTLPDGTKLRELIMRAKAEEQQRAQSSSSQLGLDPAAAKAARIATWRALESAQRKGLTKNIGVANYPAELLEEMKEYAEIMPAVNQLELHPRYSSPELRKVANSMGVVLTGYGSFHAVHLMETVKAGNKVFRRVADKYQKSVLDVVLKWTLQHGVTVIPRSKDDKHLRANLDVADDTWRISDEDMAELDALNENYPYYWDERAPLRTLASL